MKTLIINIVLFLTLICLAHSQSASAGPLGLLRINEIAGEKFTVEGLWVGDKKHARGGDRINIIKLEPRENWSCLLRGDARNLVFVSFSVYGSVGTIIETGGARLGIVDSDIDGYAQLAVDENSKWRLLGIHVPLQKFEGKFLGRFPVLTLRLDRSDGSWDLYHSARLVAEDMPIDASIRHGQFVVKAGEEGAMINGLVQSDVNPLYADENGNGVDDSFEQQKRGRLLAKADGKADRKQLIADWRKHQRTSPPPALFVNLPRPD